MVIPRRYVDTPWSECKGNLELHAFGDASLKGYGACVYLKYQSSTGKIQCTLIRACARVAPLERKTLPRLELLGSLVTTQLLQSVIKSLQLPGHVKYTCWSDSMVALGYIYGLPSKWKPWVANRVSTIQSLTNPEKWKHIAGMENPADFCNQRHYCAEIGSELWWHGPSFLYKLGAECPSGSITIPEGIEEVETERRSTSNKALLLCLETPQMFQMDRWSTLSKAYGVIVWVLILLEH